MARAASGASKRVAPKRARLSYKSVAEAIDPALFKETLVVLGATAAVIPIFYRLKLSPVVGFILTGMILGLSSLIMVIGQIGGPIIAGIFADWLGDYRAGFTLIAALAAVGSLFFWMAKRPV